MRAGETAGRRENINMCKEKEPVTLCGANSYQEKYYLNPDFAGLPEQVRKELQIMCVLFTEDVGGIITLEFSAEGNLLLNTKAAESDYLYDEIESGLRIRRLQKENEELFSSLENYYKIKMLKMDPAGILAGQEQGDEAEADETGVKTGSEDEAR